MRFPRWTWWLAAVLLAAAPTAAPPLARSAAPHRVMLPVLARGAPLLQPGLADLGEISLGGYSVAVAANPLTNRIYSANAGFEGNAKENSLAVVDGSSDSVVGSVPLGSRPAAIAVDPGTNRVYVLNSDWSVTVVDGASNRVVATVATAQNSSSTPSVRYLAVDATTNRVYVAAPSADQVDVIDGGTNALIARILTGAGTDPSSVAVDPALGRLYVALDSGRSFAIAVYDTTTDELKATVGLDQAAENLNVDPHSPIASTSCPSAVRQS